MAPGQQKPLEYCKLDTVRRFSVWVQGEVPSRNESELAARGNRFGAGALKKKHTNRVAMTCLRCKDVGWVPMDRYRVLVEFRCKDKRKDPDNLLGGLKYILDGLVLAEVVRGDRWANVVEIRPSWVVDKEAPGVQVVLEEVL
jgi:hypothetical protein